MLRVTDTFQATHTADTTATVANLAPQILLTSDDGPAGPGALITVNVSADDVVTDPLAYEFDFDGDGVFEISNTFGAAQHAYATTGSHTVGIRVTDDEGEVASAAHTVRVLPTVSFTASGPAPDGRIDESAAGYNMEVRLSDPLWEDILVPFTVTGTASRPDDYVFTDASVLIRAGGTSGLVAVELVNDRLDELGETVTVTLAAPGGVVLGDIATYSATIVDNDPRPRVMFADPNPSDSADSASWRDVPEAYQTLTVTVRLSEPSGLDVSVPISISNSPNCLDQGRDYGINGPWLIKILKGDWTGSLVVNINDDNLPEMPRRSRSKLNHHRTLISLHNMSPGRRLSASWSATR